MQVSRTMVIGWLTLIAAILALPQFVALIPESYLPYILCAAGVIEVVLRWLSGGLGSLGTNALSLVGIATLAAGVLSVPALLALIPLTALPVVTGISGILTLVTRYLAGQSQGDPAQPVNALMRVG